MTLNLPKGYEPCDVEAKWYRSWEESGCFLADENSAKPH
jgi:valyl-tRNA synthetase